MVIVKGQRVTAVAILAIPVILVILAIPAIPVIIAILTRLTVLQFEYYFTEFPAHIVILSTLRRHVLRRFPAFCRPMFLSLLASSCLVCPAILPMCHFTCDLK